MIKKVAQGPAFVQPGEKCLVYIIGLDEEPMPATAESCRPMKYGDDQVIPEEITGFEIVIELADSPVLADVLPGQLVVIPDRPVYKEIVQEAFDLGKRAEKIREKIGQ